MRRSHRLDQVSMPVMSTNRVESLPRSPCPWRAAPFRPQPFAQSGLISVVLFASSSALSKSLRDAYAPERFEYSTWFSGSSLIASLNFSLFTMLAWEAARDVCFEGNLTWPQGTVWPGKACCLLLSMRPPSLQFLRMCFSKVWSGDRVDIRAGAEKEPQHRKLWKVEVGVAGQSSPPHKTTPDAQPDHIA